MDPYLCYDRSGDWIGLTVVVPGIGIAGVVAIKDTGCFVVRDCGGQLWLLDRTLSQSVSPAEVIDA